MLFYVEQVEQRTRATYTRWATEWRLLLHLCPALRAPQFSTYLEIDCSRAYFQLHTWCYNILILPLKWYFCRMLRMLSVKWPANGFKDARSGLTGQHVNLQLPKVFRTVSFSAWQKRTQATLFVFGLGVCRALFLLPASSWECTKISQSPWWSILNNFCKPGPNVARLMSIMLGQTAAEKERRPWSYTKALFKKFFLFPQLYFL